MANRFRPVDRDQPFLIAPDIREWLPSSHRVWFVLDAVALLDTSSLRARRVGKQRLSRPDDATGALASDLVLPAVLPAGGGDPAARARSAAGRAAYDPDMLLGLLIYGYLVGMRSSRAMEQACQTDVAFRVVCAQDVPDHSTIARFRQTHQDAVAGLFAQVLELCLKAGLGDFSTVAIDGTKIGANAAKTANRRRSWLLRHAKAVLAEADQVDAAEDAAEHAEQAARRDGPDQPGGPGDPGWSDPPRRQELIRQALAEIAAQEQARDEQARRPRIARAQARVAHARARLEEETAAAAARYQAQQAFIAAGGRLGRGARRRPAPQCGPVRAAQKRLDRQQQLLEQAITAGRKPSQINPDPVGNLTDPQSRLMISSNGGIVQAYNAQLAVTADGLIIAAQLSQSAPDTALFEPMLRAAEAAADTATTITATPTQIGTVLADAGYVSAHNLTCPGPDRLIAIGKRATIVTDAQNATRPEHTPTGNPLFKAMAVKVADHKALYKRRGATVEPVNGHLKERRGLRQFARRGLAATTSELLLAALATNLDKLFRHTQTT